MVGQARISLESSICQFPVYMIYLPNFIMSTQSRVGDSFLRISIEILIGSYYYLLFWITTLFSAAQWRELTFTPYPWHEWALTLRCGLEFLIYMKLSATLGTHWCLSPLILLYLSSARGLGLGVYFIAYCKNPKKRNISKLLGGFSHCLIELIYMKMLCKLWSIL